MKPLELFLIVYGAVTAAIITASVLLFIGWLILGFWLLGDLFT